MFRRALGTILLLLATREGAFAQTAPNYINKGTVTNAQVDAVNFVNDGTFIVSSTIPWSAQNTINFTNRGSMLGSIGYTFDTVDSTFGIRRPASNFVNAANAQIVTSDGISVLTSSSGGATGGGLGGILTASASFVNINAANVTNRGGISVGANGVMKLYGQEMDLTGGTLIVEDLNSVNSFGFGFGLVNVTPTNFFPESGVYDLAYGIDVNTNMSLNGIVLSTNPNDIQTPPFNITNEISNVGFLFSCFGQTLLVTNAQVRTLDNRIDATNRVIQVIAVDSGDTNITVAASFYPQVFPQGAPQGGYLSPLVEFRTTSTDFRTLALVTNSFYAFDQLGSQTNYTLLQNLVAGTLRPAPFILFRSAPGLGDGGTPGLPFIDPNVFDNPAYSNRIVTNQYAVYSAEIQSVAAQVPPLPDLGPTNLPGRVEIYANDLKLNNTRIRAEGLISLNATNLTGGQGTVLDVPRVNLSFSTRTNVLELKDITPDSVARFGGFLKMYSAIWTNVYAEINGSGTNAVTNAVTTRFELFVVDGSELHSTEPVVAQELRLSSRPPNAGGGVLYEENLTVTNLLLIDADNITLAADSRLFLGKGVGFSYTNVLNLSSLTNYGQIQANELIELRQGETAAMKSFVNRGTIIGFGTDITSDYFENTGDIISSNYYSTATGLGTNLFVFGGDCFGEPATFVFIGDTAGPIDITAGTAKIDGGHFRTLGDIAFSGSIFKINHHGATAGGRMTFDVSGILTDSGEVQDNVWVVNNGFEMTPSRPLGDLLGTEIRSFAAPLAFVDHIWSAEDRGATVAGFTDNTAIGRLRLEGSANSVFDFIQGRENSAIYVDVLDIEGLQASSIREFTNRVQLQMNVYYGNVESTNGIFSAERLNRVLGTNAPFNFYWVTNWAGPNSGVDVPLGPDGPIVRMNRALRESPNIDSDGDGLPNLYDPYPLTPDPLQITSTSVNVGQSSLAIKFNAQSSASYVIETTTNLAAPKWQPLTGTLQSGAAGGIMSVTDQVREGAPQRYYRVRKAL
ncbi:MAG TPA: hypothetical protein VGR78_13285 [Verrucomicrobiae bacterium]|nr:hypothetical protein [Verrucomicrobiae bacterium]